MDEQQIARVLPLTTTRALRGSFDYLIGPGQRVQTGSIVRIRFSGRKLLGIVSELAADSEFEKLAEIDEVLPTGLPPDLVMLAEWMAAEYCSTTARALSLMLPPPGAREARVLVATITPAGEQALDGRLTEGQRTALTELAQGPRPAAELGTALLRRLEQRGLVSISPQVRSRIPKRHTVSAAHAEAPALNQEQRAALDQVLGALGSHAELLLHGVTGSGKTEVYLAAAEAVLKAGRSAIIMVPEIGLTPQALARFEARLGQVVAVLHSGLSQGQRHDEWLRLARGEARVCVGPRSAVFAPLENIGLIVVDEEHESSYKHEGDPRYDARLLARRRAADHDAVLLAGSATPRAESAAEFRTLSMPSRVDGRPLPAVEVLDMCGLHHPLAPETTLALADVRRRGEKAVVLLNRRGWSNFLTCADCGRVWKCPNCDVSLVLHRAEASVSCHHCGHHEPIPGRCPECGSVSVARHGAGTERIERELAAAMAADKDFPVLRLDADASGHDARARTLAAFHAARSGVLVGTQMIAKGHDFSDVSLGVVVDADQTLRFPDFRAEERTFSLLTQLAGRTGRGGAGRVLVQTMSPRARPIVLAARHDAAGFLSGELQRRKALNYPPYTTLIRIVCSSPDEQAPHVAATALKEQLTIPRARVLGPAPLFMLRRRYRAQLQIKAADRRAAIGAVGGAVDALAGGRGHRDVAFSVDVDPQ